MPPGSADTVDRSSEGVGLALSGGRALGDGVGLAGGRTGGDGICNVGLNVGETIWGRFGNRCAVRVRTQP